ncbi:MAG: DNA-binding protein WhiA [Bacilli bacterium]|nr:DNA-binding protein WhiA [Bacilli bacterium]
MKDASHVSFAQKVKEESARVIRNDVEKKAFLAAFLWSNGYLGLTDGKLEVSSEISAIAKTIYQYLHELYDVDVRFSYTRSASFLKRIVYHVIVDKGGEEIVNDLGIDYFFNTFPKEMAGNQDKGRGYMAGAFLASGSVNDPVSTNYHLEIEVGNESYAKWLSRTWNKGLSAQFDSKVTKRRNKFIVYIKKSAQISDFLILIGANEQCLSFENIRVDRDFANVDNRLQNLDTANFGKTLKAAERQLQEIIFIRDVVGLEHVKSIKLRFLMKLRLEHPDATLDELSVLLSEEMNTEISKSNINHLFRSLHAMYEEKNH